MSRDISLLDNVRVASPCPASWAAMTGDDRVRFCRECSKNVYNLSSMTKEAAEALIREKEGRLCVRYYRRADGTIMTSDCPVGLRAARWAAAKMAGAVAALLGIVVPAGSAIAGGRSTWASRLREVQPFKLVRDWIEPPPVQWTAGVIRITMPPTVVPPTSNGGAGSVIPSDH